MTRKEEQAKWQALALAYYDERGAQGIKEDIEAIKEPRDVSEREAILRLVKSGNFACSYYQIEEDMREIYGAEYDATRYCTKSGDLKYKAGVAYIDHIYTAKLAQAIEKIIGE